jgi:hypothetical protein
MVRASRRVAWCVVLRGLSCCWRHQYDDDDLKKSVTS